MNACLDDIFDGVLLRLEPQRDPFYEYLRRPWISLEEHYNYNNYNPFQNPWAQYYIQQQNRVSKCLKLVPIAKTK